ncbi:extracellular solute-binding protein [Kiloniella laminariae]|uniref:Extracellular solute-binding protein n=1 Tax=Kiloniella laminariae TaxID=454162 RepID=A0ABT4LG26_9PROT|nr:extracellular solute-binding protein [Kiloniella laminariae]MCZ4280048.1 extracellular solute-binding protein [Kiloniella laminariae]
MKNNLDGCFWAIIGLMLLGTSGCVRSTSPSSFVVTSWGGAYGISQEKAYIKPFQEEHPDKKIELITGSFTAINDLRYQAKQNAIIWDVVDMLPGAAMVACDEGLLVEIDLDKDLYPAPDGTPASKDFYPALQLSKTSKNCFVPMVAYSTHFAYPTGQWGEKHPTELADFFDLKKFPGKRGLFKGATNNLEWALLADGVLPDQLYQTLSTSEGKKRAFAKLDTIKDHIVWWEKGIEPGIFLKEKQVAMTSIYNGRSYQAEIEQGQSISTLWDWQSLELEGWVIPKGTPDLELALEFIRYSSNTPALARQASYIAHGPARRSSIPFVGKHYTSGKDMLPYIPTTPERMSRSLVPDAIWWVDNEDEMERLFNTWLKH